MATIEEIGDNVKKIRPTKASFMIDDILSNQAKLSAGKVLQGIFEEFSEFQGICRDPSLAAYRKSDFLNQNSALAEPNAFHSATIQNNLATINAAMLSRVQPRVPLLPQATLPSLTPGGKTFPFSHFPVLIPVLCDV